MQIIQRRKIFYIISLIIIIPGLVSLFMQGLNLGIDFTGGSILHVKIENNVNAGEVRSVLEELDLEKAEVQKSGDEFYIRTVELSQEQTKELLNDLKDKFGKVEFLSAESVGPTIGKELTRNAILALLIAGVLMLIYITVRFEFHFGIAAIAAIIHNVLVVLGIFSLFQWEINSSFIAAILTVIGYSINDTIVIFDRIRENMKFKLKEDRMTLLNRSIMQTLNRSINTVLTSAFALVALLVFGGATIKIFVLAMLIGFVTGAYTSIFIASPIWYELKARA
ncbi:protein translocase subunit SecF [Thermosyntropha sp.]|uniref:protein translocase subunit SecF n=1 Tax=Thermosyntropha sp. TaxID=2740820 RepID=UPI0025E794FC|nr:protein translocase subunit SecF [Thermosyntropha sp.]MBO8159943.1 protein translocase subunit SecF [Thermosyntropha sp.]